MIAIAAVTSVLCDENGLFHLLTYFSGSISLFLELISIDQAFCHWTSNETDVCRIAVTAVYCLRYRCCANHLCMYIVIDEYTLY